MAISNSKLRTYLDSRLSLIKTETVEINKKIVNESDINKIDELNRQLLIHSGELLALNKLKHEFFK